MKWHHKILITELKSLVKIWDTHILFLMREHLSKRSVDSKFEDRKQHFN